MKESHSRYGLPFISDGDFYSVVCDTLLRMRHHIDYQQFTRHSVDAVKLLFYKHGYDLSDREAIELEARRQVEKSNDNWTGLFHQSLFEHAGKGWTVPRPGLGGGFDLINKKRHIYVEIKNGTRRNSSENASLFHRMKTMVDLDPAARCYLVEVLTSSRGVKDFHFPPDSQLHSGLSGVDPDAIPDMVLNMPDLLDGFVDASWDSGNFRGADDVHSRPDSRPLTDLRGVATDDIPSRILEMPDLLGDFADPAWDDGDFRDPYEEDGDEEPYVSHTLCGSSDVPLSALTPQERKYATQIKRASMDYLYGLVFGHEEYFYDMLLALPEALRDAMEEDGERGRLTNTVAKGLEKRGVDLDQPDSDELYLYLLGLLYPDLREIIETERGEEQ